MKRVLTASLLGIATFGLMACSTERDLQGYDENGYELTERPDFISEFEYGNVNVSDAVLSGAMGPVRSIDGLASIGGYAEQDYASVDLVSTNQNGSAMHILSFYGGLEQLEAGQQYSFSGDDWRDEPNQLYVTSTNCSTAEGNPGEWDYDQQAENVNLQVEATEDPNTVLVKYETISNDGFFGQDRSGGEFLLNR